MIKIGVAKVDYTPEIGLPLMGNFRDDYDARGVHDPLFAKAIVFADDSGGKAAMLLMDICMLDRNNVSMMREFISSQCDIAGENILIAATHTHSGPAPAQFGSLPPADEKAVEAFLKKASEAVLKANDVLKASSLAIGYTREDRVSFYRRLKCKDGKTHMNWERLDPDFVVEPLGTIDPELITLTIEQQGNAEAALVNFGLHPAILSGDNWLYSADYPGYLAEAMGRIFGENFETIFCQGCCGNVNHIDYKDKTQGRGYQMTQRVGYMLAVAAQEAMKRRTKVSTDMVVVASEKVALKHAVITEEQYTWCKDVLAKAGTNPAKGQIDGLPDEHYAKMCLDMYEKQNQNDYVEVMTIRIGDIAIVGLPGEIFCEFGMAIKHHSPAKHTLVLELANDSIGYIPTIESFEQGGYEPATGSTMYQPGAGEKLVRSAFNQLSKLPPSKLGGFIG
ncbi:MAG: neutral/alkaline non-lysosomal ceramidase N-terminal domain-containing protein [Planctomycetota bacterium]